MSMGFGVEQAASGQTETTKSVETSQKTNCKGLPKAFKTRQEMKEKIERRSGISTGYGFDIHESRKKIEKAPGGHTETTKSDETSQKTNCKGLPKGFQTRQEMKAKIERRSGISMGYGFDINESRKKFEKAPGGHTETTKSNETSSKRLPKGYKTRQEMEMKLKRGPEKNASFPVSVDDAPYTKYDQRVEMSSTTSTGARPKTRRNTYCIAGNEAYVIDNSAGHRVDRTYTKKNDIGQERFVVITMNTNGQNEKMLEEPQDKRREVITKLLKIYTPAIMFCQEFQSENIHGRVWSKYGINTNYIFYGNKEGNILAHKKLDIHLSVKGKPINTVLLRILEGLQRSSNDVLNKTFPLDFNPLSRMCMYCANIKLRDGNTRMLLCASWHGWWNKKTREDRIELFEYFMEFLRQVFIEFKQPLIIGGDFNIDIHDAKELVNDPFSMGMYVPSKRRKDKEKDFFIVSKDLRLENIQCIDYEEDAHFSAMWKNEENEESNPNNILDHDPIKATLKFA